MLSQRYYPGNDYWAMNQDGIVEYKILLSNPKEFFTNIFQSPYSHGYTGFFDSVGSYWNDLRYNIILKVLALLNFLSRGNYYINSLLLNFLAFFGIVALYRVFRDLFPLHKTALIIACFLLPSTLYFSAGIHKDLFVYSLLGVYLFALHAAAINGFNLSRALILTFSLLAILLLRNYVALLLLPVSICYLLVARFRVRVWMSVLYVYGTLVLLSFLVVAAVPSFRPLKVITQKQADFAALPTANSGLKTAPLDPTLSGFVKNFPEAFEHGFLRPYLWDSRSSIFLLPLAMELFVYQLLFVLYLIRFRNSPTVKPLSLLLILFGLQMVLLTGYIIPNSGSIARYRSIYLPFLVLPLLASYFNEKKTY